MAALAVAPDARICARHGCRNPVVYPQRTYCSALCSAWPPIYGAREATCGQLLRQAMARRNKTANQLAKLIGCDPSHISRAMRGQRRMSREVLDAVVRILEPDEREVDVLYTAAGYVAPSIERLGGWDHTLADVVEVLSSVLSDETLEDFRRGVLSLCRLTHRGVSA